MKRIGVLAASEPELQAALLSAWEAYPGVEAEVLEIGGVNEGAIGRFDAILDRVSLLVPFYRRYLRAAALSGVNVVVDPFHPATDDAFLSLSVARRLGLRVARTVLLPQHDYPTVEDSRVLGHLEHPLRWSAILDWVGRPAVLRPATPGGEGAVAVDGLEALWRAFDQTGAQVMMVQEQPASATRLRACCVGSWATVSVEGPTPTEAVMTTVAATAQQIRRSLGFSVCESVFGLAHGGAPMVLEAARPFPELSRGTLGEAWPGAVEALAEVVVDAARTPHRVRDGYPFAAR